MSRRPKTRLRRGRGRPRGRSRPRIAATVPAELHARILRYHERCMIAAGTRVSLSAAVETLLEAGLRAIEHPAMTETETEKEETK